MSRATWATLSGAACFRNGLEEERRNLRIGLLFKELRLEKGMTQDQLAREIRTTSAPAGLAFLLLERLLYCCYEHCFFVNVSFAQVLMADCR